MCLDYVDVEHTPPKILKTPKIVYKIVMMRGATIRSPIFNYEYKIGKTARSRSKKHPGMYAFKNLEDARRHFCWFSKNVLLKIMKCKMNRITQEGRQYGCRCIVGLELTPIEILEE